MSHSRHLLSKNPKREQCPERSLINTPADLFSNPLRIRKKKKSTPLVRTRGNYPRPDIYKAKKTAKTPTGGRKQKEKRAYTLYTRRAKSQL